MKAIGLVLVFCVFTFSGCGVALFKENVEPGRFSLRPHAVATLVTI